MATLIVFLGRSIEGILKDAAREFGDQHEVLVISRDGDTLEPPAGLTTISVSEFQPEASQEYILVANGGTTSQLLPIVKRLGETKAVFTAWDLQRDGKVQVW